MAKQLDPIEMDLIIKKDDDNYTNNNDKFIHNDNNNTFIVVYLQRLASISICISSIIFGICIGNISTEHVQLSAIRTLVEQITNIDNFGVNKYYLKNRIIELYIFNINFIDEWNMIFVILSFLCILLSVSAIFYLNTKRMKSVVIYVVFNFLFVIAEIVLVTSSMLTLNKFQNHNQIIINSIKKYDDKQLLMLFVKKIFNSSQSHIMILICLFIALSILKFVTIPITLLTLSSSTKKETTISKKQSEIKSKSISKKISIQQYNKIKNKGLRLSEIHYPKPPQRKHYQNKKISIVHNNDNNDDNDERKDEQDDEKKEEKNQQKHSFTSSMLEGHGDTKRRNTISEFSMHSQRYPSLPSETNRKSSDSEMLYINKNNNNNNNGKQCSEGLLFITTAKNQEEMKENSPLKSINLACAESRDT